MNIRKSELTTCLQTYLDRKSIPMNLNGKPDAQQAEINALLHSVLRHAPARDYLEWWGRVEVALGDASKTRGWPTEGDIRAACMLIRPMDTRRPADVEKMDRLEAIAQRMERCETVGDTYFFGRFAVEMKSRGLVTEDTLRKYRSAWYFAAKAVYTAEKLVKLEAEMKSRQASAEKSSSNENSYRAPTPPVKRMAQNEWDGAGA